MTTAMLNVHADELMFLAASSTPETASHDLAVMDLMSRQVGGLVTRSLVNETQYMDRGLRAATVLAAKPTLETIIRGEEHTQAVAAAVTDNIHALATTILKSRTLSPRAIDAHNGREAYNQFVGRMSEIGAFGVYEWGVAHGLRDERAYALPATRQQDSGYRRKHGLSLATDIVIREPGKIEIPVQVKTSDDDAGRYHRDIAFVTISRLLEDEYLRPRQLLIYLATRDNDKLGLIHQALDERLEEARTESVQGNSLVKAVRSIKHVFGGRGGNRTLNP